MYDEPVTQYVGGILPWLNSMLPVKHWLAKLLPPEAIEILLSIGMHCLGCPASRNESLQDACAVHGIPAEQVIEAINEKIAENK